MAKETGIKSWKELSFGIAITNPGNAAELKTGDWRSMRPETDREKCTKCGQCYIFCPDMVYSKDAEGYYAAELLLVQRLRHLRQGMPR